MVALTDYWYYGQVERIMLHTARFFCDFYVSVGKDANGEDILQRVPLTTAFNDVTAAGMMTGNSDTYLQVAPRMILQLTDISMNTEKAIGPAYQKVQTIITERAWNAEEGNYYTGRDNGVGDTYEITRLNPIPMGLTFKLHILTSMYSQKFQLFEQIRPLFAPQNELQVSENPLDWSRTAPIELTDIEFSSKLSRQISSNELDDMIMTFKIDTNLDMPAEIMKARNDIHQVNIDMDNLSSKMGWDFNNDDTMMYTPTDCSIRVEDNNKIFLLEPYGFPAKDMTWKTIYDKYKLSVTSDNVNISLLTSKDVKNRLNEISGKIKINQETPTILDFTIDSSTLPAKTIDDVNDIIDPLVQFPGRQLPKSAEGQRYLIISEIAANTTAWGMIKDASGNPSHAKENQIIEYKNGFWTIAFDPTLYPTAKKIVRCMADDLIRYLYVYDDEDKSWVDYINRYYKIGYFRFWTN